MYCSKIKPILKTTSDQVNLQKCNRFVRKTIYLTKKIHSISISSDSMCRIINTTQQNERNTYSMFSDSINFTIRTQHNCDLPSPPTSGDPRIIGSLINTWRSTHSHTKEHTHAIVLCSSHFICAFILARRWALHVIIQKHKCSFFFFAEDQEYTSQSATNFLVGQAHKHWVNVCI